MLDVDDPKRKCKTHHLHRNLQLENHNPSILRNQIPPPLLALLLRGIRIVRPRRKHNPILPRLLLDDDIRRARRLALDSRHALRIDPLLSQSLKVVPAKPIIADVADHGDFCALGSEASACDSLVGAFAAEAG
jgi:hypothetical protein